MSTGAEPSQDAATQGEPTGPSQGAQLAAELQAVQTPLTEAIGANPALEALRTQLEEQPPAPASSGETDPLVAEALARQAEGQAAAAAWEAEQAAVSDRGEQVAESAPDTEQEADAENPHDIYRQQMNDYFGQARTREELDEMFVDYISEQPLAKLEASSNGLDRVAHAQDEDNEASIILADAYNDRAEALAEEESPEVDAAEAQVDPEAQRSDTLSFFAEAEDPAQLDRYLKQLIAETPVEGRPIVTLIKTSSGESFAQAGVFTDKSQEARSGMIAQLFNERMGELVRAQATPEPAPSEQPKPVEPEPAPATKTPERTSFKLPESLDKPELSREVTEDFKALVAARLAEAKDTAELAAVLEGLRTLKHFDKGLKKMVVDQPGYIGFDPKTGEYVPETVAGRRAKGETGRIPRVPAERSVYILEQAQARAGELVAARTPDTTPTTPDAPSTPDTPKPTPTGPEPFPAPSGPRVEAPATGPKPGEALRPPTEADVEAARARQRQAEVRIQNDMRGVRPDLVGAIDAEQDKLTSAVDTFLRVSAEEAGNSLGIDRVNAAEAAVRASTEALKTAREQVVLAYQERLTNSRQLYAAKAEEMQTLLKPPVSKKESPIVAFRAIDGDPAMTAQIVRQLLATKLPGTEFTEITTKNDVKVGDRDEFIEKTFVSPDGIIRIDRWDARTGQLEGITFGRLTNGARASRETLPDWIVRTRTTLVSESVPKHEKLKRLGGARKLAEAMRDSLNGPADEPGRRGLARADSARRLQRDVARGFTQTASDLGAATMADLGYAPENMLNMKFSKKLTSNSAWYQALSHEMGQDIARPQPKLERAARATKRGAVAGAKLGVRGAKAAARRAGTEAVAASKLVTEFSQAAVEAGKAVASEQKDKLAARREAKRVAASRPLPPPIPGTARQAPEAELPPPTA